MAGLVYRIREESLRPPEHPDYGAEPRPRWVLLDYKAYVANRSNCTTARGYTRAGDPVEVTFWTAPPPGVSYWCLYRPDLEPAEFPLEPKIICTEADLVLLRYPLRREYPNDILNVDDDYFVYQAAPTPSLHRLPHPGDLAIDDHAMGLLRLGKPGRPSSGLLNPHAGPEAPDQGFIVAMLGGREKYKLSQRDFVIYLYRSSSSNGWTSHKVSIREGPVPKFFAAHQVITVGVAGTMGWVDLHEAILFCDILADGGPSELRYFLLPQPIEPTDEHKGLSRPRRDIAVVQGLIKYAELHTHFRPGWVINGTRVAEGWSAAVWSMPATSNPWKLDWHMDYKLASSDVSVSGGGSGSGSTMHFELLPKLRFFPGGPEEPIVQRLHYGLPHLSLLADDIVYLMAKLDARDDDAWVLAVDVRNKTLKDVAEFGAQRTYLLTVAVMNSRISQYLPISTSAGTMNDN